MLISRQLNRVSLFRRLMAIDPAWMLPTLVMLYFLAQVFSPAYLARRIENQRGGYPRPVEGLMRMLPQPDPAHHGGRDYTLLSSPERKSPSQ